MRNAFLMMTTAALLAVTSVSSAGGPTVGGAPPAATAARPPPVAFEPFPELAKPQNPAASPKGSYNLTATFSGVDSETHQSWTYTAALFGIGWISSPRDPQTRQATGRRIEKPVTFTMPVDSSIPQLFGGRLQSVLLKFTPVDPNAKLPTHTIKLSRLVVLGKQTVRGNARHADLAQFAEYEEVGMTYQKIEWTWTDGGKTASDDWENRT